RAKKFLPPFQGLTVKTTFSQGLRPGLNSAAASRLAMKTVDLLLLRESLVAMLGEDIGTGDITARATIPPDARADARYVSKQPLVAAGIAVIQEVVRLVDPEGSFTALTTDGASAEKGIALAEIRGSAPSILTAERTSLNLLQRMCGIATHTRQYVQPV